MQYTSKYSELRLIMQPTNRMLDDKGRVVVLPGKKVEFVNYRYGTQDPEIIAWMHKHHLNGMMFYEIKEEEVELVKKQIEAASVQITTGANTAGNVPAANLGVQEPRTVGESRPEDKIMINSDLAEIIAQQIDTRVQAAFMEIKALLQKDLKKEEDIKEDKPRKSFKCPYCGEAFASGFKVGTHKPECAKKPQAKKS